MRRGGDAGRAGQRRIRQAAVIDGRGPAAGRCDGDPARLERRRSRRAGPADADRLRGAEPPRPAVHEGRAGRPQPADVGAGKRGLHAPGGLQAHAVAESRAFLRGVCPADAADPRGPRPAPQPETRRRRPARVAGRGRRDRRRRAVCGSGGAR